MKRIAYLLVVVMLLACLPLTAFAAKAGDEVTINFTIQNQSSIKTFAVIFDILQMPHTPNTNFDLFFIGQS